MGQVFCRFSFEYHKISDNDHDNNDAENDNVTQYIFAGSTAVGIPKTITIIGRHNNIRRYLCNITIIKYMPIDKMVYTFTAAYGYGLIILAFCDDTISRVVTIVFSCVL